jgi:hypothetical protein
MRRGGVAVAQAMGSVCRWARRWRTTAAVSGDDAGAVHAARTCAKIRKALRALEVGMLGIIRGLQEGVNDDFRSPMEFDSRRPLPACRLVASQPVC